MLTSTHRYSSAYLTLVLPLRILHGTNNINDGQGMNDTPTIDILSGLMLFLELALMFTLAFQRRQMNKRVAANWPPTMSTVN
jgi:hypothetical protein